MKLKSHSINLDAASELTANFRACNPDDAIAQLFTKDALDDIFRNPEANGLRIYGGEDSEGVSHYILVGVKISPESNTSEDLLDVIKQGGLGTPPFPIEPNKLNGGE